MKRSYLYQLRCDLARELLEKGNKCPYIAKVCGISLKTVYKIRDGVKVAGDA